jgi:hypothetical protein
MKLLLLALGLYSAGGGFYFGITTGNFESVILWFGLSFLLLFAGLLLAVIELLPKLRKNFRHR